MLVAGLLAKSGDTMVGLAMGFVAYQQTESALVVAVVGGTNGLGSALIFVGLQMLIHGIAPEEHLERVVSLDSAVSRRGACGARRRSRTGAPGAAARSHRLLPRLPILRWALITATLAETLALPLGGDDAGGHRIPEPRRRRSARHPRGMRRGGLRLGAAPAGRDGGLERELLPHDAPHALGHHVHGGVAVDHRPTALGRE
jgi:hypothetical protein